MAAGERLALVLIQTPGRLRGVKKRGRIVAWRETGFSLSVVAFNEILRSHMCVYCKRLLPVSLKCTDEQGVALLKPSHFILQYINKV